MTTACEKAISQVKWQYINGIQWHKKVNQYDFSASDFHSWGT